MWRRSERCNIDRFECKDKERQFSVRDYGEGRSLDAREGKGMDSLPENVKKKKKSLPLSTL